MLCVRLDTELHKRVAILCIERGTTLQGLVTELLTRETNQESGNESEVKDERVD